MYSVLLEWSAWKVLLENTIIYFKVKKPKDSLVREGCSD